MASRVSILRANGGRAGFAAKLKKTRGSVYNSQVNSAKKGIPISNRSGLQPLHSTQIDIHKDKGWFLKEHEIAARVQSVIEYTIFGYTVLGDLARLMEIHYGSDVKNTVVSQDEEFVQDQYELTDLLLSWIL